MFLDTRYMNTQTTDTVLIYNIYSRSPSILGVFLEATQTALKKHNKMAETTFHHHTQTSDSPFSASSSIISLFS